MRAPGTIGGRFAFVDCLFECYRVSGFVFFAGGEDLDGAFAAAAAAAAAVLAVNPSVGGWYAS